MLRFLSYNHIFTYVILFVITVLLRIPSFHPNYYQEDEAFYLVSAQKIVDGGVQYVDTWDNKPPMIVWFYSFFVWVFGSWAIVAIRIFTCGYLYLSALILNQFVADNKLLNRFSLLPAFLLIFLCSVPWYAQEMNGEMLMMLPVILAVVQMLSLSERTRKNTRYLFVAGLLLGLSFMIKYQAIFIFLGLFGAYLTINTPRLSETFSLVGGFLLSVFVIVAIVYFRGALDAFWDVGVVYNLDYIFLGKNPGENVSALFNLGQYAQLWGVFVIMALVGVTHFRLSYFTNSIRLRKVDSLLLYWLVASLLTVIVGGGRLYLHYFYVLVPPLAIYAAKFTELKMRPWLRTGTLVVAFFIPLFTIAVYFVSVWPSTFSFLDSSISKDGWIDSFRKQLNEEHPLARYVDKEKVKNGILVMSYEPTIYTRLDLPCATKYTNFSMAQFKLAPFKEAAGVQLISRTETLPQIYRSFAQELPEYIFDPQGLFPILQERIPILFADYQTRMVNDGRHSFRMYYR